MSENSTFIPTKSTSRAPKMLVRRPIPEAQPRVAVLTVRNQRESGSRAFGSSTARSGHIGRNGVSLITGKTSLTSSTVRRGILTPERVHASTAPTLRTTEAARARTSTVANAEGGVRARQKLVGRGGKISVTTSSSIGVKTGGPSSSSLQKGQLNNISCRIK